MHVRCVLLLGPGVTHVQVVTFKRNGLTMRFTNAASDVIRAAVSQPEKSGQGV
jgi:hypothetical protein